MVGAESFPGAEYERPPQEACGVFAVRLRADSGIGPVAQELAAAGIAQLGHRGDENTGEAVIHENGEMTVVHGEGDAEKALGGNVLLGQTGLIAMAHGRYATSKLDNSGENLTAGLRRELNLRKTQPMIAQSERYGTIAQSHNGDIKNAKELTEFFGYEPGSFASDSELALTLVRDAIDTGLEPIEAIRHVSHLLVGAYSMNTMIDGRLFAWRDPWGFRPLFKGEFKDAGEAIGWTTASEQPAFEALGGEEIGEVQRGSLVEITDNGFETHELFTPEELEAIPASLCIFEFVYFARPDTRLNGQSVGLSRVMAGEILAKEAPVPKGAIVVGSPNSGLPAAEGFAHGAKERMMPGLVKNPRDSKRSFMQTNDEMRRLVKTRKTNADPVIIGGNIIARVDDSAIRGNTSKVEAEKFRTAGATEVHERIASPPYAHPCHFGMDTKDRAELIAANMSLEEMRHHAGVDSLAFLSLGGLLKAVGAPESGEGFCTHCLTGNDPTETPVQVKMRREYVEAVFAVV